MKSKKLYSDTPHTVSFSRVYSFRANEGCSIVSGKTKLSSYKTDEAGFSPSISPLQILILVFFKIPFNIKKNAKIQYF